MVQFHSKRNKNLRNNDAIYEVVMVAGSGSGPSVYTNLGNLSGQMDAFGRVRQSTPYTLFDSHNLLNENTKYDETTAGSGSSSHFDWDYQLGQTIAGTSDTLTLAIRASSSSKNAAGIIKWFEL